MITRCYNRGKQNSGLTLKDVYEGKYWLSSLTLVLNFMRSMLCDPGDRLGGQSGQNGAQDIMMHPFFAGVQWNELRSIRAPFEPQLSSNVDVSYFPIDEIPQEDTSAAHRKEVDALGDEHSADMALPFIGYTFKRFETMRN